MIKRFLLLLVIVLTIGCPGPPVDLPAFITIENEGEHNITWVIIMDAEGYAYISEKNNELIAKNGDSKTFELEYSRDIIVCVKAENIPELMCAEEFATSEYTKTLVWNGSDDSMWKPK